MMIKQMPIKKTFFDKKSYSKENFQEYIRSSDWSLFWMSQNANEMKLQFFYHSRVSNKCACTIEILFCEE